MADDPDIMRLKRRAEVRMEAFDQLPVEARAKIHEQNATVAQMLMLVAMLRQVKFAEPPEEGRLYRRRRR